MGSRLLRVATSRCWFLSSVLIAVGLLPSIASPQSRPQAPPISPFNRYAASIFVAIVSGCVEPAWADQICEPDSQYINRLASDMQKVARSVTDAGAFSVKEEYPGDGTGRIIISFADHGKVLFTHTAITDTNNEATIRPAKTKTGDPGLLVYLRQGRLGDCEYAIAMRDGSFTASFRGFRAAKR